MLNKTQAGCLFAGLFLSASGHADAAQRPNVLFISIDDLNDWTGALGGHPQAKTPNIDRLAAEGINFTNAHCDSPACGPSRAAVLTGIHSHRSGAYRNNNMIKTRSPVLREATLLPALFMENGYFVGGTGKIHHQRHLEHVGMADAWTEYWPSIQDAVPGGPWPRHPCGARPPMRRPPDDPLPRDQFTVYDWYAFDDSLLEDMPEVKSANWIIRQLEKDHDQPFFLGFGIQKPHVPWYVPQMFFDMHPLEEIILPEVKESDLDDVPHIAARQAWCFNGSHEFIRDNGLWEEAVQAYLAASSYADYCVGLVLDALDRSPYRDNTIVVLWSDHGFHLGEKNKWQKFSLWERATRSLLMWRVPGMKPAETNIPANLSDMYPTLVELCNLPDPSQKMDAVSLVAYMRDPTKQRERPALTAHFYRCYSLRTERWRYSVYSDGSEELYDHLNDPHEWTNLAGDPAFDEIKEELAVWLPQESAPPLEIQPLSRP